MILLKEIGIYIHIPFCKRKCFYCDFCSFECNRNIHKEYVKALINEIRAFNVDLKERVIVKTLYIGGGTPSFIDAEYIQQIVDELRKKYDFDEFVEATIEVNPGTASFQKIKMYKEIGFNRISIGLQSTNDKLLSLVGRIHSYNEFEITYDIVREVGFKNINVDLMIGLPTQTIEDVKDSLNKIIKKKPEHISVYSLILEDGTELKKLIDSNQLELPEEDIERSMYWQVKETLEKNGYEHYEISNFSKPGFQSKHNTDCWNQKEYFAFGLAAHSYFNNIRYANTTNLKEYIENDNNEIFCRRIEEVQDKQIKMNEFVILGLRMVKGFSTKIFEKKFQVKFEDVYEKEVNKLLKMGLIELKKDTVYLTNKGIDFANIVWSEFV